ncbi:MAG: MBL fold metallo-hydrolase [Candidatus Woesearchaeota archaeon]|jgi:phosphoribosyl 1,2-cyclic phosphodiesterase|nr:MBL fold metallo-hydrolase [Candidatus Woesearchaeota archaeon]|tara:strand:- start:244 stop:972 length:729 start_codon:yes stop_codon:yes gene_type:complete
MEISVIASGSNGNCCLVEDKGVSLLIDAGKSGSEIETRMKGLGKSLEEVDGIVITHEHSDHISGAGVLSRRFGIPVYMTKEVYSGARLGKFESRIFSGEFKVGSLKVKPVVTSHNVSSCGFVVGKFGYFTDTGIVTGQMKNVVPGLNSILLESNHDVEMVHDGRYPVFLKKWILSDEGHLSNDNASSIIQEKGKNLSFVLLGHLSENHNTPDIASETFNTLVKRKIDFSVCSRDKESGSWKI